MFYSRKIIKSRDQKIRTTAGADPNSKLTLTQRLQHFAETYENCF